MKRPRRIDARHDDFRFALIVDACGLTAIAFLTWLLAWKLWL